MLLRITQARFDKFNVLLGSGDALLRFVLESVQHMHHSGKTHGMNGPVGVAVGMVRPAWDNSSRRGDTVLPADDRKRGHPTGTFRRTARHKDCKRRRDQRSLYAQYAGFFLAVAIVCLIALLGQISSRSCLCTADGRVRRITCRSSGQPDRKRRHCRFHTKDPFALRDRRSGRPRLSHGVCFRQSVRQRGPWVHSPAMDRPEWGALDRPSVGGAPSMPNVVASSTNTNRGHDERAAIPDMLDPIVLEDVTKDGGADRPGQMRPALAPVRARVGRTLDAWR